MRRIFSLSNTFIMSLLMSCGGWVTAPCVYDIKQIILSCLFCFFLFIGVSTWSSHTSPPLSLPPSFQQEGGILKVNPSFSEKLYTILCRGSACLQNVLAEGQHKSSLFLAFLSEKQVYS